jgi:hypothetical protein
VNAQQSTRLGRGSRSLPGAAAAPLLYWLLLVCGLAVLTLQRIDALDKVLPLWVGAVAGTALGHLLAVRRLRLWLVVFLVVNGMWCGALVSAPFWLSVRPIVSTWEAVELSTLAFAPAAICAYLSLAERAALAAFWFPAVLWMLAVLDRDAAGLPPGSSALGGAPGWLLLAGLGALLVAFLHVRETRRVVLWQSQTTSPTAPARRQAVLRQAPLRSAARAGWIAFVGAATVALTAWIAPYLWQREKVESRRESHAATMPFAQASAPASSSSGSEAMACCQEAALVEVERNRVREYLPVLHAHDDEARHPAPAYCIPCTDGVPPSAAPPVAHAVGASTVGAGGSATGPAKGGYAAPVHPGGAIPSPAATGAPRPRAPAAPVAPKPIAVPPPPPVPTVETPKPSAKPEAPKPPPRAVTMGPQAAPYPGPASPALIATEPKAPAPVREADPLRWLLTLAAVGLVVRIALRPLRRLLTLRHLRRPFWAETVDQRVSNLWQLALVGLRDVGWRQAPCEQPQELARRIGLDGMSTCAAVLERVRHGVRVDGADLEAMERAAEAVYRSARGRAGRAARAASWVRWPLV